MGGKNPRGAFDFSSTTTNPFDSGDGFSNALLGVINTYSEGTARVNGDWIFNNLEFYVQDNWRVSKRLTLDIGMRFYHLPPQTDTNQTIAGFNPSLVQPGECADAVHADHRSERQTRGGGSAHRRALCQSPDRPVHSGHGLGIEWRRHRRTERLPGRPV